MGLPSWKRSIGSGDRSHCWVPLSTQALSSPLPPSCTPSPSLPLPLMHLLVSGAAGAMTALPLGAEPRCKLAVAHHQCSLLLRSHRSALWPVCNTLSRLYTLTTSDVGHRIGPQLVQNAVLRLLLGASRCRPITLILL